MTWFIITWFLAGLITFAVVGFIEYRGKEYEDCDFEDVIKCFVMLLVIGYISPILAISAYKNFDNIKDKIEEKTNRFIYKIFNVGLKDKGEEHE